MINEVTLIGYISSSFNLDHESYGERFYRFYVSVKRTSGALDNIPVIISERLIDTSENYTGSYMTIQGQYRSFNSHKEGKTRLILYLFATNIELLDEVNNFNEILLEGTICKPTIYRETPQGRQITDIMLAVSRDYGKNDYIPCIAWGRNAFYLSDVKVGTDIRLVGRVQSRNYNKDGKVKTAYEVSISLVELA